MKFKIRYADQIVGFFVVLSLVALVFVTVMLGRTQRWFAADVSFQTSLSSAAGLSRNMAVQYRGFTIGTIQDFHLTDADEVKVIFSIFEEYISRARLGSMVEVVTSPIGLGNQFIFHSGRGGPLSQGDFIPIVGSAQAQQMIQMGIADPPEKEDSISLIMSRVISVLDEAHLTLFQVNEAFGAGTDATEVGRLVSSLQTTIDGIGALAAGLDPVISDIGTITQELADPSGLLFTTLDAEGEVYASLMVSLYHISSILENLDRATAFVPAQLPQLAGLIMDLRGTVRHAEDVLIALTNNPLLRRGVPERQEAASGGMRPRNIRF
ncbi:MAG: MlaD family protein [Treponema sp.]|nr:MlaD family protein [Treponema sp.]